MSQLKVVQEIGRGGFGLVEQVKDSHGKSFARKTFSPSAHIPESMHTSLRNRFKREVRIQMQLGGNEIIQVLDSNLNGDSPWYLMPLAVKTFEAQIAEDRKTGLVNITAIADIVNALQYLHELDYVHRDLSPKNILLHDGHWKLSDLGAVLPLNGNTVTLTQGTVIYTEQYCSPEQRNEFHGVRPSADIYAFGCILHDIFGSPPRTPYAQHHASGQIGIIIEKCTEQKPERRPSIKVLRDLLLEELLSLGGKCQVVDHQAEAWLAKLGNLESWTEPELRDFARFFSDLDINERTSGLEQEWVYSQSTPFLTRIPAAAIKKIVEFKDGISNAIVEKYCLWAGSTAFDFAFVDSVSLRLETIFDNGTPTDKAISAVAMIKLATTHNRFYVMREILRRCGSEVMPSEIARRLSIEIITEEIEQFFNHCVNTVDWDKKKLPEQLFKMCR